MIRRLLTSVIWWIASAQFAWAGPPFTTDDPEPVEYRHWEVYLASQLAHDKVGWSGTAPHLEVNYGATPNMQLHLIAPLAFTAPSHEATHFGYGDTEAGVKYRFFEETDLFPQIGTFPLVEIPSGNRERGLGSGHAQLFFLSGFRRVSSHGQPTVVPGTGSTRAKAITIGGLPAGCCSAS